MVAEFGRVWNYKQMKLWNYKQKNKQRQEQEQATAKAKQPQVLRLSAARIAQDDNFVGSGWMGSWVFVRGRTSKSI